MKSLAHMCGIVAALSIVCLAAGQDRDEAKKDGGWHSVFCLRNIEQGVIGQGIKIWQFPACNDCWWSSFY